MIDNEMTNILKNLNSVGTSAAPVASAIATSEKNSMKSLLEGLDAAQKGVNQMPAQHKMAKNTGTKHPASKYLVGGEEGDPEAGQEVVAETDLEEEKLGAKQSFADVFKSMDESEEEKFNRLKSDLHSKLKEKVHPTKNDAGKYNLAEESVYSEQAASLRNGLAAQLEELQQQMSDIWVSNATEETIAALKDCGEQIKILAGDINRAEDAGTGYGI
jgi:hypothetical protein